MKINVESIQGTQGGVNVSGKGKAPAEKNSPAMKTDGEQIRISELSRQLQAFETTLSAAPDVNMRKVAEIKQAISDGSFKVNAEAVADSLISGTLEFLQRQQ